MSAFQLMLWIALFLCVGWALLRGPRSVRFAASTVAAASLATALVNDPTAHWNVQWTIFWIDVVALAAFAGLWAADRGRWLVFLTAIQLLTVCEHLAKSVDAGMASRAYGGTVYVLFIGVLGCLIWGARGRSDEAVERTVSKRV